MCLSSGRKRGKWRKCFLLQVFFWIEADTLKPGLVWERIKIKKLLENNTKNFLREADENGYKMIRSQVLCATD